MAEMARSLMDYAAPPVAQRGVTGSPAQPMSLMDYLSDLDLLNILNGTGIPERLALVNETLNPLAAIPRAQAASQEIFAPDRSTMQRIASTGDMLSEVGGVVVPMAASTRVGVPAATALVEGLLGGSPATQAASDAARRFLANESGSVPLPFSASNPAAERGAQIIDMLTSGRADEITDQMLDMGDPVLNANLNQYLYRNYDLPMDEASRMARAAESGFTPVLHGTGADITAIDPNRLGEKQDVLGRGFYTTTSQNRADTYAPSKMVDGEKVYLEGANIMPLMVKENGLLDLTQPTGKDLTNRISDVFGEIGFDVEVRGDGDTAFIKNPQDPKQSVMIDSYQTGQATLARLRDAFGKQNLTNIFSEAGYSGLKGAEGGGRSVRVSYNPEDVRARSARFDPRLSHLRNLSAGIAPFGLLALQPNEEQY
jgi:hypothetical protein